MVKVARLWSTVRIEVFSLGDLHAVWRLEVVASHDIVDIVDSSGSHSDFGEISGPDATIGVLGLILREVGGVDMIVDISEMASCVPVSLIPLLVIELLVVVMGWMDGEVLSNPRGQFQLFVDLVEEEIVLLADHSVAVGAVFGENLKTYMVKMDE
jgi:hypothetical protein